MENDSVKLLKECNSGIKMGVNALERVIPHTKSKGLKQILNASKDEHATLGDETHRLLLRKGGETKDPHPVARVMSDMKIRAKMLSPNEHIIADIMTDGCDMGIKSVNKYKNRYKKADEETKDLANRLVALERRLEESLREYL